MLIKQYHVNRAYTLPSNRLLNLASLSLYLIKVSDSHKVRRRLLRTNLPLLCHFVRYLKTITKSLV